MCILHLRVENQVTEERTSSCVSNEESKKWLWIPGISSECTSCIKYEASDSLGNGVLPTGKEVMELLLTFKNENTGKHINNSYECSIQVVLQWIYCTVCPRTVAAVRKSIEKMDEAYKAPKKSSSIERSGVFEISGDSRTIHKK